MIETAAAPSEPVERRAYSRIDARKARTWSATLKPNSDLRQECASHVAILRAIYLLHRKERRVFTYCELGAITGYSWRQVQRAVNWAKRVGFIGLQRVGGGKGMIYTVRPHLSENFLGVAPRQKRARDMPSMSHHKRLAKANLRTAAPIESEPRCDAAPNPPTPFPDKAGKGGRLPASPQNPLSEREGGSSERPTIAPALSNASKTRPAGASQRSNAGSIPTTAPTKIAHTAEDRAKVAAVIAEYRAWQKAQPPPPIRTRPPPRRLR